MADSNTVIEIKKGMGLEDILLYEYARPVYSSLLTQRPIEIVRSLNPDIPSGATAYLDELENTKDVDRQNILADAMLSHIHDLKTSLSISVQSDLTAQNIARDQSTTYSIIDQLVPYQPGEAMTSNAKQIIDAVATPVLKSILQ